MQFYDFVVELHEGLCYHQTCRSLWKTKAITPGVWGSAPHGCSTGKINEAGTPTLRKLVPASPNNRVVPKALLHLHYYDNRNLSKLQDAYTKKL